MCVLWHRWLLLCMCKAKMLEGGEGTLSATAPLSFSLSSFLKMVRRVSHCRITGFTLRKVCWTMSPSRVIDVAGCRGCCHVRALQCAAVGNDHHRHAAHPLSCHHVPGPGRVRVLWHRRCHVHAFRGSVVAPTRPAGRSAAAGGDVRVCLFLCARACVCACV